MDRRTFLKSSGAVAAATATTAAADQALATPAVTGQTSDPIRTVLSGPFASGYLRDRADRLALRIAEISDNRIRLEFDTSGDDGFGAVAAGKADAYFATDAGQVGRHGVFAYVSGLPGDLGLSPEHFAMWLSAGGGQMHWDSAAAEFGIKALAAGHTGRRTGIWAKQDVTGIADLGGRSIASRVLAMQVANGLGLKGATDVDADIVEPLMGPTMAMATSVAGERSVWLRDGLNQNGLAVSFGLSLRLWERLPDADKALLTTVAGEAFHENVAEHDAHDREVAPHLFKPRGVRQLALPDDVQRGIRHVSQEVIEALAAQDPATSRIHESYMVFRKNVAGLPDPLHTAALV